MIAGWRGRNKKQDVGRGVGRGGRTRGHDARALDHGQGGHVGAAFGCRRPVVGPRRRRRRSGRARAPKQRAGWGRRTRRRRPGGRPGGRGPHRAASAAPYGEVTINEKKKENPPARRAGDGRGLRGGAGVRTRGSRGPLASRLLHDETHNAAVLLSPHFPPSPSRVLFKSVRGSMRARLLQPSRCPNIARTRHLAQLACPRGPVGEAFPRREAAAAWASGRRQPPSGGRWGVSSGRAGLVGQPRWRCAGVAGLPAG